MSTVYAFDLDGTITTQEILPLIASELGLQEEMKTLTELTLKGVIPFEASFRLRCAILRSVPISVVREIVMEVPVDKNIARFIKERREQCFIVTGNLDVWIQPLLQELGCIAFSSTAVVDGDSLIGPGRVLHKSSPIQELKQRNRRVVAIGESVNDIPMFEVADIGVAFGGVHNPAPALLEIADYVTYDGASLCRLLSTL